MNAELSHERRPAAVRARRAARLLLSAALASVYGACAAGSRDPEAGRPRGPNAPPYPVVLGTSAERRERAVNNWLALARPAPGSAAPELQPITATVRALPAPAPDSLRLPLVEIKTAGGADAVDADEATRESLRRFIDGARDLLGVDPQNLSLQEFKRDAGGGFARYLQKPFPHPVRNGYGVVEIRFAPDRRVLSLASTALPDAERLTQAIAALRPYQIAADQLAARLAGRSFNFQTTGGAAETFTVAPGTDIDVRELVIFPVPRAADASALEIRLAWETVVGRAGTNLLVYADAVTGEILSAARTTETPRPTPTPAPATPAPTPSQSRTPTQTPPPPPPTPAATTTPPPAAAATPTPQS